MNVDHILRTFGEGGVEYLLIGGMNFLLRHEPVLTYDIDFWIRDTAANLDRCHAALQKLDAAWGPTEQDWRPIAAQPGWLGRQDVFCLTSSSGAIDIFRAVKGLPSWADCNARAHASRTAGGVAYRGLCDAPPSPVDDDLARREHDRRERAWIPAARWQAIQETICWAEAQANARRNTPAACIAEERRRR